jgi:hypothetical protein
MNDQRPKIMPTENIYENNPPAPPKPKSTAPKESPRVDFYWVGFLSGSLAVAIGTLVGFLLAQ